MVPLILPGTPSRPLSTAGFRLGEKGTHTSRTMMLAELRAALENASPEASRSDYAAAVIESNCLNKPTASTRRLSNQRLGELYGLEPSITLFRVMRRLWFSDEPGRPLLALLLAIARDPLLAASVPVVARLKPGEEYLKSPIREAIGQAVQDRLNDATLDKVVRNVSSSWVQSGHLTGRTFKRRVKVMPTPAAIAFALYLASLAGYRGEELLDSPWTRILDATREQTIELALAAKRLGFIDIRIGDRIVDLSFRRLDPAGKSE